MQNRSQKRQRTNDSANPPKHFRDSRSFFDSISDLSIFFEHNTAIKPTIALISDRPKAMPKPIFLFLPKQPMPNAIATAITKKKALSIIYCSLIMFKNTVAKLA